MIKINLSFLKPKKTFKKDTFVINPNIYWRITVYFSLLVMFASFAFGFFLFKKISVEPEIFQDVSSNNSEKVKKDRLLKALNYFSAKEKKSLEIVTLPPSVIDPSTDSVSLSVPSVGIEPTSRP